VSHDQGLFSDLNSIFGPDVWPPPLNLAWAVAKARKSHDVEGTATAAGVTKQKLRRVLENTYPLEAAFGIRPADISDATVSRAELVLGQMLIGRCAESAFEDLYKSHMGTQEFRLEDLRESRNDTDYRLYNGSGRPLYRMNIKYLGSAFRRAAELVGLAPEDCFALATYKIHGALQKQEAEHLPYLFSIVQGSKSAREIGGALPRAAIRIAAFAHGAAKFPGKRNIEDRIVDVLVGRHDPSFADTMALLQSAGWYVISARRADNLLRRLLFERVFALRIPGFTRQFGRAELDMHFSLSGDMIPLVELFDLLKSEGLTKVATMIERGDI
jgi:hypothetical protein